jgi:hypothetical protein
MRTALLFIVAPLVLAGCSHESRPYDDRTRAEVRGPQRFEAVTTDGEAVLVEQDARTGGLYIVGPGPLHGQPVAIVNPDDHGRVLVTRDARDRRFEGSAGDNGTHRDDHH